MKKIHFLAGIPRTGSSVLSAILNQHPEIHSADSRFNFILKDLDLSLFKNTFKSGEINNYLTHRRNIISGFTEGFFKNTSKEVVIDKNIEWTKNYNDVEHLGLHNSKIIICTRPLVEIISSYVNAILKNSLKNSVDETLKNRQMEISIENRALIVWEEVVKEYYKSMQNLITFVPRDMLMVVDYKDLTSKPKETLKNICDFLEVQNVYEFDFNNIKSNPQVQESNELFKFLPGLHDVQKELIEEKLNPVAILGQELVDYFEETDIKKQHFLDVCLGKTLQGKFDEAEEIMNKYSFTRNDNRVIFNAGLFEMVKGNLKSGFRKLSAGRFINSFGEPAIPGPLWEGQDLKGKKLLLRLEGGLGDEIINFRFHKDFTNLGADVVVSCDRSLMNLFRKQGVKVIATEDIPRVYGQYDYWVPAMSAPEFLNYEFSDLSGKPYIESPSRNLPCKPNKLKVGIRWAGNPKFEHQQFRKFDPIPLVNMYKTEGTSFYSLQRDVEVIEGLPFYDMREEMQSWEDTASIIKKLDLVITSCTSIAHLSASMGVPTWVIVPKLPYYIWAHNINGNTSPWYDSVKLYRQETFGTWDNEMERIQHDLIELVKEKNKQ
jgi:hypothetical protein